MCTIKIKESKMLNLRKFYLFVRTGVKIIKG